MKERKAMNRITLALVAVVLLLPHGLFAVTFGSANVAVGDTWTETSSYGTDMTLTIDNGMGPGHADNGSGLLTSTERRQRTSISRTKKMKVTALQGHRISGLEVEFTQVMFNGVDQKTLFAVIKYVGLDQVIH